VRHNILASLRVAAVCVAAVGLSHCHASGAPNRAAPNTLVVAVRKEPESLNPLLLEGINAYIFSELLYSYLTTYDRNGAVAPDLAREVPSLANGGVSADGRTITYHLRSDARWQDGVPVTSRDVAFTYSAIMNPANNVQERYGYDVVSRLETPDRYTVVVRLKRAFSPILTFFFGGDSNYPVLPAHKLARYPNINAVPFNLSPVGSGPYRLDRWNRGDRIELDANPSYVHGKPKIERLVLPFVPDDSTVINQLRTGELDAAFFPDTSRVEELRAIPGHRVIVTPVPYFYAISFNLDVPVLADLSVRTAVSQAIDRDSLVRKITLGVDDSSNAMRGLFTWAYDRQVKLVPYDPAAAKALLTRDGWLPGSDGIRTKAGKRLSLQLAFPTGSNVTTSMATAIEAAEREIGVDMSLRQYDRNQFVSLQGPWMQGRTQLALYDYQGSYDPDASWLLACDQRSPRGFDLSRYCNPAVDALLHKAAASYDRGTRSAAYRAVQRTIAHDLPYDFLCQISEVDVIPSNLGGYTPPLLSPFNFVANWYRLHPSGRN
jgi:peptide/nickel transport system substrate-binding protein